MAHTPMAARTRWRASGRVAVVLATTLVIAGSAQAHNVDAAAFAARSPLGLDAPRAVRGPLDAPPASPRNTFLAPPAPLERDTAAEMAPHVMQLSIEGAPRGRPAMWRLSDRDSVVWIFGSIHALPPGVIWDRRPVVDAMRRADVVYFETELDQSAAREMLRTQMAAVRLPGNQVLFDLLSDEARETLDLLRARRVNVDAVRRLAPWAALRVLASAPQIRFGAQPLRMEMRRGVEVQLLLVARQLGTPMRAFLDPRQQMEIFTASPIETQVADFELFLAEVRETMTAAERPNRDDMLRRMVAGWRDGDLAAMETMQQESVAVWSEDFTQRILDDRNEAWAEEIDAFMRGSGSALVVGGIAHFVGRANVIDMLRARGWRVERY